MAAVGSETNVEQGRTREVNLAAIEPTEQFGPRLYTEAKARKNWAARRLQQLDQGDIEALARSLRELRPGHDKLARDIAKDAEYFVRNAARMRYPRFRAQGLFLGSGVMEAGRRAA